MLVVGLSSEKQKSCAKWHSLKMKRILEVVPHRFERWLREPKTLVLPLHHGTSFACASFPKCVAKIGRIFETTKPSAIFISTKLKKIIIPHKKASVLWLLQSATYIKQQLFHNCVKHTLNNRRAPMLHRKSFAISQHILVQLSCPLHKIRPSCLKQLGQIMNNRHQEGIAYILFTFFQVLQCSLHDVVTLVYNFEVFVAVPKVVCNGRFECEHQFIESFF